MSLTTSTTCLESVGLVPIKDVPGARSNVYKWKLAFYLMMPLSVKTHLYGLNIIGRAIARTRISLPIMILCT